LAVQDTTAAHGTHVRATEGCGPLGHPACPGLLVHTTLALTPERGPLGLLAQQVWARAPDDRGKRARRQPRPISQKDSQKWLQSLDAVSTAHDDCPTTRLVSVGERAADVSAGRAAPRPAGVELRRRAAWKRCGNAPQRSVWATVAAQPVVAQLPLHGPRPGLHPAREALVALRSCPLTVAPPQHRQADGLPAVTLGAVQVAAGAPPAEVEPSAWRLFTPVAVEPVDDAIDRGQGDACRWGMEVWPRMVQRGWHVAARQVQKAERWRRAWAL
jgi:hypothetical protein